ncbi:YchJ family protein [Colwellia asteriadis]|uniref:YchJ family protein n=1 Tax=Colwellia asteriadis TaxID=517723 RepID=A0ABP3WID7_9GAMM
MINTMMLCPCGSKSLLIDCCQPYINGDKKPESAEQLMRSRFSAYALCNATYIFNTYAAKSQVDNSIEDIKQWAKACKWLALEVHQTTKSTVEFSAYYIHDDTLCELREHSNFVIEQGTWRYLDGDISKNDIITKVKRNEVCPCNNYESSITVKKNKKYKHCCAN